MKRAPGHERILKECPKCSDRRGKTYMNIKSGCFICYACAWAGRSIVKFIAVSEGVSDAEARKIIFNSINLVRPKREEKIVQKSPGLPIEYIPCYDKVKGKWNGIPLYLRQRNVSKKTIMAYKLGWCERGKYADRIIIPILTNELISFQARATWDVGDYGIKYDSPKGAPHRKMLVGYHLVKPENEIWLVEGPMDVLACFKIGVPAVGIIGKTLSVAQINLLGRLKPKAVHIMLDPEALKDAVKIIKSSSLSYVVDDIDIVQLQGGDPDELEPEDLARQAINFKRLSASMKIFKNKRL